MVISRHPFTLAFGPREAWDLIRTEGIPAYKEAGIAWRHVFANGPFGQGFTFNSSTPAPFVVVQTLQPLPGRGNEYNAITEKEYIPIYKKAGVKDYWFYINNYGAPQSATTVRPINKIAELDQPSPLAEGSQTLRPCSGRP